MSLRTLHALNAKLDATLHQFQKLDLGYTYDEMYGSSACGLSPSSDSKKVQYPSLYVSRTKGDVMDLPETGKAVVEYVLTGRNMSKRDGKTSYGMDLQIKSFDPQGAKKMDAKKKADGEAVEMGAKCSVLSAQSHGLPVSQSQSLHSFSDRTRNNDGQFVGNVTGGADPVTMRQAYGQKPQRSLLAPGAGAAALAGAGLLGTQAGRGMTIKAAKGAARMVRSSVAGLDRKIKGKTGERWPVMGSKAKPKMRQREGLGAVIIRQSTKSKTAARMPRFGD